MTIFGVLPILQQPAKVSNRVDETKVSNRVDETKPAAKSGNEKATPISVDSELHPLQHPGNNS
jgi:hypothetical protein